MTTELVLLVAIFAFITGPVFFGDKGPIQVFGRSGPRLAARLEQHVATGREFKTKGTLNEWNKPDGNPPTGRFE